MWSMAAAANKLGQIRRKVQGQSLVIISSFSYRPPRSVLRRRHHRIGRVHFQSDTGWQEGQRALNGVWRQLAGWLVWASSQYHLQGNNCRDGQK